MTDYWTPEALARLDARLGAGIDAGLGTTERACVVASVRLALAPSDGLSDELPCASPSLRRWAIAVNDWNGWASPAVRAEALRELAVELPGTAELDERAVRAMLRTTAYAAADRAVRVHAPAALDRAGLGEHAAALRALAPVVDDETAHAAETAADAAGRSSAAADSAAYAAIPAYTAHAVAYAAASAETIAAAAAIAEMRQSIDDVVAGIRRLRAQA